MYAGFWKRAAAFVIDALVVAVILLTGAVTTAFIAALSGADKPAAQDMIRFVTVVLEIAVFFIYYVGMEASRRQATLGKMALGIKVTDINGNRITYARSLLRNLAMGLSNLTLGIGYLMCIWTAKKQCLHDMVTKCLVVDKDYPPTSDGPAPKLSGCLIALVLLPLVPFVLGLALAFTLPQYFRSVEQSRTREVKMLMDEAAKAQTRHLVRTGKYAEVWTQLDAAPSGAQSLNIYCTQGQPDPKSRDRYNMCQGGRGFLLTLDNQRRYVFAIPQQQKYTYFLIRPYNKESYGCIPFSEADAYACGLMSDVVYPIQSKP